MLLAIKISKILLLMGKYMTEIIMKLWFRGVERAEFLNLISRVNRELPIFIYSSMNHEKSLFVMS